MSLQALVLALSLGSALASADPEQRLHRAVVMADAGTLQAIREELQGRGVTAGAEPERLYTLAYINWRLAYLVPKKQRKAHSLESERALKLLLESRPEDAEALALLGSAYGARITGWWSGMTLGKKAGTALDEAAASAPNNPRVALQRGISSYFSPKTFGGGLDRAEEDLRRSLELFARQPTDQPWPNWGHVDAWAWLGRVLAKRGDSAGARQAYERGLELEPDHRWIREVLLPELD